MGLHLITGGNGYVGSFLARKLAALGERVRCVDLSGEASHVPGVDYRRMDILDAPALRSAMQGVEYVHHNAALVPLRKAGKRFWQVNVEGTRAVLMAAEEAGVRHFSHMSSSAVYGTVSEDMCPLRTTTPPRPVEAYGRSKYAAEQIILEQRDGSRHMTCSIIRPKTILGPERLGIFQILFEWISEGANVYIIGDGSNRFQFAYIDDIVAVSIETAMREKSGIFNIGTDRYGSLREALEGLCRHAATGSRVIGLPVPLSIAALWIADMLRVSPLAPWHYLTYHRPFYCDLSNEFRELEWRPAYSNEEMLIASYEWYLNNRSSLGRAFETYGHRGKLDQGILRLLKLLSQSGKARR
jgi:nucleoside-diphosphate-sugar epimerase